MSVFKKAVFVLVLFLCVSGVSLFAFGATEVPEIPPVTSGTQYLSPNADGIQDEATLKFSVKLYVKSDEGYVPEYGLRILDPSGEVVAEKIETEESDVFWFFQIFRGYDEFSLDKEITWDGKDVDGNVLPDGIYNVQVWVKDATQNVTEIDVDDFVLDTTPPEVKLKKPQTMLFSPNNDGNADVFIVLQADGTVEAEWTGVVHNSAGKTLKTFKWENQAPGDVLWDGTDDEGNFLPNGKYNYLISSTDLAGNKSEEFKLKNIEIDAGAPAFMLESAAEAFSPNADGVLDELEITPVYEQAEAITEWSWSIADNTGVIRQSAGSADDGLPEMVVLDGLNESGLPLYPGSYLFSMSVEYINSWRPVAEMKFDIDIAAPNVDLAPERVAFSPNGDGLGDALGIKFRANEPVTWEGSIIDMTGAVVLETDYSQTSSQLEWTGKNNIGEDVPDGDYLVLGVFTDLAGNVTYAEPFTVKIDRRPVATELVVPSGFSPNTDGFEDTLTVGIDSELYMDVNEWKMMIIDDSGESLASFKGTNTLPTEVSWDGMVAQEGNFAPALEGMYQAVLYIDYVKGDFVKAESDLFVLDNRPPKIKMVVNSQPFAETEKGLEGSVFISVEVEDNKDIRGWVLDIYDQHGNNIRTYAGKGDPSGDITWNTADNGIALTAGEKYTLKFRVTDNGGNTASLREVLPLDVLLIKKDGKYFVMVPNIIFGAYNYKLDSAGPAREKDNIASLKRLIELSERFPDYGLVLDAHALNIYLNGGREKAEENILFPLTEKRAEEVRKALIELGLDEDRISMEAFGGQYPIVSVTDRSIRWKNRRVEFAVSGIK
jgi:flagellar hook assembly protein FlgD